MSDLVGNPEDRFSCVAAQFTLLLDCARKSDFVVILVTVGTQRSNNVYSDRVSNNYQNNPYFRTSV